MLFGKFIGKYYLRYIYLFIIGILCLVCVDFVQMYIPEFLGKVVAILDGETIVTDPNITIRNYALGVVIVGAIMLISRLGFRFSLQSAAHRIAARIRKEMYDKAVQLPVSYFHENPVGNVMSWFTNDVSIIADFLSWGTVMEVDAVFLSTFAIIKLFNSSWQLALIAIIPISLIVVWGALVESRMSKMWEYRQKAYDELYDYSQEAFTGIRVIKAFVKENQQLRSFSKIAKKNKDTQIRFVRTDTIFNCVINIIINSISAIIIGVGGWLVISCIQGTPVMLFGSDANVTASKLVEFAGYFDILIWPMIAMGQVVTMYSRSRTSLKRIKRFVDAPVDVKNPENPVILEDPKGKVEFKNFSFTYPGEKKETLTNISLTINPGETIGVVGKIGSGKTTLVNALMHIYNVNKDSIMVDDVDIMDCDLASLRDAVSYVPQDNFLYSDKIANNIAFSNENASMDEIQEAAKFACVNEDIEGFVDGYDTISGERGVTLSGGQKQRISIARAYLKNAPILIMDDSVSAVDTKTEEVILRNIKELRKGKTTILIASRISTVSSLDKIIVLKEGKLEAFGPHDELMEKSPTYQAMAMLQELEKEKGGM